MRFADPNFLFALVLVLIPILIHWLQFKRYKTIYFSQVGFLKTLLNESKKKNNIKQLVILLCRIGLVTFVVLAFARPYIPLNPSAVLTTQNITGIYLDNSFSMNGLSDKGTLLDKAKLKAIDLANSFAPGTKYYLLTNDANANHRLSLNKEQLVNEISQINSSAANMKLSQAVAILTKQVESDNHKSAHNIYLLSDFQKQFSDFDAIKTDSTTQIHLLPFEQQTTNNLLIDSCWQESPGRLQGQNETLKIRITNQSSEAYNNIPLRFYLNDSLKALQRISLKARETVETELNYKNLKEGIHYCQLVLDDYPITYDNACYFSYKVENAIQTLAISEEGSEAVHWLEKLFHGDDQVKFQTMSANRLQLSALSKYQCIFLLNLNSISEGLQAALVKFVKAGGSLVVFPGESADQFNYNQFFSHLNSSTLKDIDDTKLKIDKLNLDHHLFKDVFTRDYDRVNLPSIYQSYRLKLPLQSMGTTIMTNNDGSVSLAEFPSGKGRLYQFSFPLETETTDFFRHALFVPVLYNMALHSYFPQTIQYEVQPNEIINLKLDGSFPAAEHISLKKHDGDQQMQLPKLSGSADNMRFSTANFVQEAGFYDLMANNKIYHALAFNYNRAESDMNFYSAEELSSIAANPNLNCQVYQSSSENFFGPGNSALNLIELWKYFILMAIACAISELLVIRFWK
ncbi:vWA domain-containing protein [Mangrovibacterium lignilyticum]|uniref:vWA domain-containing protein n=1 Tax=Mangrovibacterium lignilyticum TaxID=2668052 RepID=UPI0013D35B83|nr:BatA and WFA domain-containing protein [Mangrovibacterium lignilyticum]